MKLLLLSLFLFAVGSFLGWVLEVFYRRFFSAKKWVNPGFMKGPWVPLYGFGVLVMFAMCYFIVSFFPESIHFYNPLGNLFGREYVSGASVFDLIPLVIMWLGMVGLEFIAGLIFIKGFQSKRECDGYNLPSIQSNLVRISNHLLLLHQSLSLCRRDKNV